MHPGHCVSQVARARVGGRYAWYVLGVTTCVSSFSLLDRQIVTIVGADLKADLHVTNAELGLLYGTVFAIFYALFGIPLARLADSWVRTRLMAWGLAAWSVMTVATGLSTTLPMLAVSRAGVAVGEASANPAAMSMLADWFAPRRRATALALYNCGVSLGLGASLGIGGAVLQAWHGRFPGGVGWLGLHGWQAAFIVVGLPGLLLAGWVATLREPPRGLSEGFVAPGEAHPFRHALRDLGAVVPPFSLFAAGGRRDLSANLIGLGVITACGVGLTRFTERLVPADHVHSVFTLGGVGVNAYALQWATIGLGVYAAFAWILALRRTDRPTFALLWATPASVALGGATASFMTINYGLMAWTALYAIGRFHAPVAEVGITFGALAAGCGLIGTASGGYIADWARRVSPRGRLYVSLLAMVVPWPLVRLVYGAPTLHGFYVLFTALSLTTTAWLPGVYATAQDLVLPRMRGASAAMLNLATSMIGLGLGPFIVGMMSDRLGSLGAGVLSIYWLSPLCWGCMAVAILGLPGAERSRVQRAALAGETVPD